MSSSTSTTPLSGGLLSLSPGVNAGMPQSGAALTTATPGDPGGFYTLWMGITAQGQMVAPSGGALRQNPVMDRVDNGMELPPETAEQLLQKLDQLLQQVGEDETDLIESAVELLRLGLQQTAPDGQIMSGDSATLSGSGVSDAELLAYLKTLVETSSAITDTGHSALPEDPLPLSDSAKDKLINYLEQKLDASTAQTPANSLPIVPNSLSTEEMLEAERLVRQLWSELESARQARAELDSAVNAKTAEESKAAEAAADDLKHSSLPLDKSTESTGLTQLAGGAGHVNSTTHAEAAETNPVSSDLEGVMRQSDELNAQSPASLTAERQAAADSGDKVDRLAVPLERPMQSRETEKERERRLESAVVGVREPTVSTRPVTEAPRTELTTAAMPEATMPEGGRSASIEQAMSDRLKVAMSEERSTTVSVRTESNNLQSAEAQRMAMPSNTSPQAPIQQAQNSQDALMQKMLNPAWSKALGERAVMMAQQGPRVAEVRLDPPELGSLRIRVQVHGSDQVSLSFNAPSAAVREVLEQSMPRLREMFAEQGLNLTDASVGDQSAQDRADKEQREAVAKGFSGGVGDDFGDAPASRAGGRKIGLIDYYA
ncbi:flagellar hook-length control protein FliK [Nitrincola sp.]|uniref:flagellar hook-length control protein FliK n=1 Tax=Nitrincola sp. TaxID=1926584 RepID=UPI003A94474A